MRVKPIKWVAKNEAGWNRFIAMLPLGFIGSIKQNGNKPYFWRIFWPNNSETASSSKAFTLNQAKDDLSDAWESLLLSCFEEGESENPTTK